MQVLKNIIYGAIIGVANIIPGVSGGTMAVVLKIYDRLIEALSLKNLRRNLPFLLAVGAGAGAGILLFSRVIKLLLEQYPVAINFAFMGLILGSIPMIFGRARGEGAKPLHAIPFLAAFVVMLCMSFLGDGEFVNTIKTALDFSTAVWLVAVAAISTFAMILPGISGSFVMLVLGAYTTVLTAISELNIIMLLPVAAGCLIGLLGGSRVVGVLLRRFPHATYFAILGLVVGSLFAIYPGFTFDAQGAIAVLLLLLCSFGVYRFSAAG